MKKVSSVVFLTNLIFTSCSKDSPSDPPSNLPPKTSLIDSSKIFGHRHPDSAYNTSGHHKNWFLGNDNTITAYEHGGTGRWVNNSFMSMKFKWGIAAENWLLMTTLSTDSFRFIAGYGKADPTRIYNGTKFYMRLKHLNQEKVNLEIE